MSEKKSETAISKKKGDKGADDIVLGDQASLAFYDAQVMPGGLLIDRKYEVWRDGVYKRKTFSQESIGITPSLSENCPIERYKDVQRVTNRPCYVSSIGQRLDDDRELICLSYLHSSDGGTSGDRWENLWVKHGQVANTKRLLELCDEAFPVRSSNAQPLSDYLTDCYDFNLGLLPSVVLVRRLGYHSISGQHGWLVGRRWVGQGKVVATTAGDDFARSFTTRGSEQEWLNFTKMHIDRNWFVGWVLACSFTAPLLRFIGQRTFIVHHFGKSSGGKTTLAKLAQSGWAHPTTSSLALNRSTQNALTETFKIVSDLPVLFDEMQGNNVDTSAFIMQVTTETHKARVHSEGGLINPDAKPWRTLIRITGEQVLAGAAKGDLGGQANRVIEVKYSQMTKEQATEIYNWVETPRHFGFAGVRFLDKLSKVVNDEESLLKLQDRYRELKSFLEDTSGKKRAVEAQLAAIALGEYLMFRWIYGIEASEALAIAKRDAVDIMSNWLRSRDGTDLLWERGIDALLEHRSMFPQQYANVTSEEGRMKLAKTGSRSTLPIMALTHAGVKGDEIWYIPNGVNKFLREKFDAPADRIWEELASEGILERNHDRLVRHRQIKGVFNGPVYVLKAVKLRRDANANAGVEIEKVEEEVCDDFASVPEVPGAFEDAFEEDSWNNCRIIGVDEVVD
jgi:hypothetical protein